MPEGIIATDTGDGFVTLDFVDTSLRGPALAALIDIGGPGSVETITRKGPRRQYRVPVGNAEEAELIDEDTVAGPGHSAGYDTGAAAALVAADPNVNPGADNANWHTPVDEHTSANAYVGQVPNATVLDRDQVYTGSGSSFGGSGEAATHREVIDHVKAAGAPPAGGEEGPAYPDGEPSLEWTRAQLDAYAADMEPPLDTTGLATKADVLAAINDATSGG